MSELFKTVVNSADPSVLQKLESSAHFDLSDSIHFVWEATVLTKASGKLLLPVEHSVEFRSLGKIVHTFSYEGDWKVRHTFFRESAATWRVATLIINESFETKELARITMEGRGVSSESLDRVFWQTEAMDGFGGVETSPATFTSWGMAALSQADGTHAFLGGFSDFSIFHSLVSGEKNSADKSWKFRFSCELENRAVSHGQSLRIPDLFLRTGDSLAGLLEQYAGDVGNIMGARSSPPSPHGWCSWYCYYGTESEEDILTNLENLSRTSLAGSGAVFQIDDGWNLPRPGHGRVWGDWHPGEKFPRGMAWLARKIREKNLTPGLWLAPFSVDSTSELAGKHPEWLLQARDSASGELHPVPVSEGFALDLTQREVLDFIRTTFRRVFSEWGFDYVKIDFLKHSVAPGIRRDSSITSYQALRNALKIIREEAGPGRFILGCGCPFGPAIGICDGMRIGMDVGGGWDPPLTLPEWPDGNCCVKSAAKPAFYRHWMHRRWWINDPDCVVVRQEPLSCEVEELTKIARQFSRPSVPARFCLSDNEVEFWAHLVSMLGGSVISSDIWTSLPPERQKLLEHVFLDRHQASKWIDWYENPELCFLQAVGQPLKIGIFNFSDETLSPTLPAEKLGLSSWNFQEDSTGRKIVGTARTIGFPPISPRSAQIWHPVAP